MTWMTPFEAITSGVVTRALFRKTFEFLTRMRTLLPLARGWGSGGGPRALLACPPGERHDLGLIVFGLALRNRGWRIDFLGSDTPTASLVEASRAIQPALLVISATAQEHLSPLRAELEELARSHRLAIAGAGASSLDSPPVGVLVLTGDPVTEAQRVSGPALNG